MKTFELIKRYQQDWNACVHHKVLEELACISIPSHAIAKYYHANVDYLLHLKDVYEHAQQLTQTKEEKRYCKRMLDGLQEEDFNVIRREEKKLKRQKYEHPTIRNYALFYAKQLHSGCFMKVVCASLPCTLTYAQIGKYFPSTGGWQDAFMESFKNNKYTALCKASIFLMDTYLEHCSQAKQEELATIFQEGCYQERCFWDMIYKILKEETKMDELLMKNVETKAPLVHCITNYVTVNDCANMVLAAKGSPIMADDEAEVEEITSICNALVINIGTLNERTILSMIKAGKKANELRHPVILDPVGAGASKLRTETVFKLLNEVKFSVIRGNISEMKTIYMGNGTTKGVDADIADLVSEENVDKHAIFVKDLAKRTGAIIIITGAIDLIGDEKEVYAVRNGHSNMSRITGTGCQLTTLLAVYVSANPDYILQACVMAVSMMGIAGEMGVSQMQKQHTGTNSLRTFIIDAISMMNYEIWKERTKYERIEK